MTVLFDPVRQQVFTDQPVFPLQFARGRLDEMAPFGHTERARLTGVAVLHSEVTTRDDDACTECGQPWPCKSYRLATEDLT